MKNFRSAAIRFTAVTALVLASCQHSQQEERPSHVQEMAAFSGKYEEEIREILILARSNEWDEAEVHASGLYALDPDDPRVTRVYNWVVAEATRRRENALEAEIASITAQESRFTPTIANTFFEHRKRGLPLPSDVREAIEQVGRDNLIPDSYGKVIEETGRMFDLNHRRGRMAEILDQEVTIQLDNVTLESIIFNIGQAQGVNFIADRSIPAFKETLSVNMQGVQLREFLTYVSRNLKVTFQMGQDLIWIMDGTDPKSVIEETRFYRLRKGFVMPAEFGAHELTKVTQTANNVTTTTETAKVEQFVRDGAPRSPSLEFALKDFFPGSKYMIDFERNLIVATGTHDQHKILEQIIEAFDTPLQQVLIEARFLTVTKAAFMQLGVSWETGRDPLSDRRAAVDFTGFGTNVGLGLQETFTNVLSRRNLSATLTALEQSGESQTLSSPRITVLNNRPANISDGKVQYYYEEYTVSQTILERRSVSNLIPKGKPTKLTSGVSLDVLASIGGDGRSILLALRPKVSQDVELVTFATVTDRDDQGNIVSTFDIKLPESRDQEISTRVVVQSGETVVMGGVVQRHQSSFTEAVPILGNIPVIGAAFRKRTEFDQPRYLLIFVTATLLSDDGRFVRVMDSE
jgi:type IV pilus assembly protein PilQ